jgi:hypothetical protein
MAEDNITPIYPDGNYDEAADLGLRKLKNDKYREAIDTITKLTPTATRYLHSIQEFSWLEDDEIAGRCAYRFIEVAREIAKHCNVVIAHGRDRDGKK